MKKTILLSAKWCGPCQILKVLMEKENLAVDESVDFDTDRGAEIYKIYGVRSVPTLVVVDGEEFELIRSVEDISTYLANKD